MFKKLILAMQILSTMSVVLSGATVVSGHGSINDFIYTKDANNMTMIEYRSEAGDEVISSIMNESTLITTGLIPIENQTEISIVNRIVNGELRIYRYDSAGNLTRMDIYFGNTTASGRRAIHLYESGNRTSYRNYNSSGQIVSLVELYANGQVRKINNYSNGVRTHYRLYDTGGNVIFVQQY